jgi:hydroxymethylglutaryl-CoA lyase
MRLPAAVRLVEVGPRDGLQNEKAMVPTDVKVALIDRLTEAGFAAIEAASFVSPKWVPQMADAADVMARIRRKAGVRYPVLTPNMKGFEAARIAGADEVAVFVAASETFSQKNINCSIAESLERARPIFAAADADGIRVRGYISCVLGCPYEGDVDPRKVADVAAALHAMGAYEISLGDTIGTGTAGKTRALFQLCAERLPVAVLAGHFHDTYGQALTNVYAALELGVATFDCSVAGLGGCPYAKGATGNVASEDVVYLLDGLGIATGVDMTRLRRAGQYISDFLQRPPVSRVARAMNAKSPLPA